MSVKYEHLLSPVRVGNFTLKNRLISGNSLPHFLQGPETFPSEPVINHMVNVAKNGAAVVTFADWTNMGQRVSFNEDGKRFPMYTLDTDPSVENYMCQLADQVHYYNSRISIAIMPFSAPDPNYDVNDEPEASLEGLLMAKFGQRVYDNYGAAAMARGGRAAKALSHRQIQEIIEMTAQRMRKYQKLGFDMGTLHFAYRATLFGRFLSPKTNRRTDEYGGCLENRARFLLEMCARIKELCGRDFPIEVQLTPSEEGGTTIEDTIKLAKLCEGLVDVFQLRADTANLNHPTGYNSKPHFYYVLEDSAKIKASGTSILCAPIGGFQDPQDMDEAIAQGKADLIAGARMFFVDFDSYDKIKTGKAEDITPCIRCNKCHVPSLDSEWLSYCSVNPVMGIEHRLNKLTKPVGKLKKVAVVGGGPAGMRAAILCCDRGHSVTLFEAGSALGGQLNIMDGASFKWPLVQYRQWLKGQIEKRGIDLRLNTRADRALLEEGGFEAVILALGATPKLPPIPGAEKAYNVFDAFTREAEMGRSCVVIGGSESGTEAGLYLAERGHEVKILTRGVTLAPDATPIQYRETIDEYYQTLDNISYETGAVTTEIGDGYVVYKNADGQSVRIECDSVVALGGMEAHSAEAMEMYGVCADTVMIGDCFEVGNLHTCNRGAFSAAYNL